MSAAARRQRRWTKAAGVAAAGRTAGTTAFVFASAALLALWIAGPRYEARAVISGLPLAEAGSNVEDLTASTRTGEFAAAVAERIGTGGFALREPSLMDRISAIADPVSSRGARETARRQLADSVSIEAAEREGRLVVSAIGDDAASARALAQAVADELNERLSGPSAPTGTPVVVAPEGGVRTVSQPFLPVALIAGFIGLVAGAVSSGLGRLTRARRPFPTSAEVAAVQDDEGRLPGSEATETPAVGAAGRADEAVSVEEVAAALTMEPVSSVFVIRAATSEAVGLQIAERLAQTGASVLLLDFSHAGVSRDAPSSGGREAESGITGLDIVPVGSVPSELSQDDRSILAQAGNAYEQVIVDCGYLAASEVAVLADESCAVLVVGKAYAGGRAAEFEEAGLAILVLAD